ncbi:MAG: DEAD/DEAH box helicase, partial [Actinobacteria bacterium]|nr:DEAD/DEAH box helicase [Actinomycetota bacterium]
MGDHAHLSRGRRHHAIRRPDLALRTVPTHVHPLRALGGHRLSDRVASPTAVASCHVTFAPDPFQVAACTALDEGASVLVAAPTGSGKTFIAEHAIRRARDSGRRAFYTAPLKALSNQKFRDFQQLFGNREVGLLTGDTSVNPDAPVLVMTTEVLRNMIYARSTALENLAFVVLDEVHFLQDEYRGPVWEEVIIHLPLEVSLVCLSATVSNANEVAEWLTTVRGDTRWIVET